MPQGSGLSDLLNKLNRHCNTPPPPPVGNNPAQFQELSFSLIFLNSVIMIDENNNNNNQMIRAGRYLCSLITWTPREGLEDMARMSFPGCAGAGGHAAGSCQSPGAAWESASFHRPPCSPSNFLQEGLSPSQSALPATSPPEAHKDPSTFSGWQEAGEQAATRQDAREQLLSIPLLEQWTGSTDSPPFSHHVTLAHPNEQDHLPPRSPGAPAAAAPARLRQSRALLCHLKPLRFHALTAASGAAPDF